MHLCEKCGEPVDDRYRLCYSCWIDRQESQKPPENAQTPSQTTYTPPKAVCAPNARETAITKAHEENMEANNRLIAAIIYLADSIRKGG